MALAEIISAGLNNPDCSFYTGAFVGQFIAVRYILFLVVIYFIFRVVDSLAFTPLLNWTKKRLFK